MAHPWGRNGASAFVKRCPGPSHSDRRLRLELRRHERHEPDAGPARPQAESEQREINRRHLLTNLMGVHGGNLRSALVALCRSLTEVARREVLMFCSAHRPPVNSAGLSPACGHFSGRLRMAPSGTEPLPRTPIPRRGRDGLSGGAPGGAGGGTANGDCHGDGCVPHIATGHAGRDRLPSQRVQGPGPRLPSRALWGALDHQRTADAQRGPDSSGRTGASSAP